MAAQCKNSNPLGICLEIVETRGRFWGQGGSVTSVNAKEMSPHAQPRLPAVEKANKHPCPLNLPSHSLHILSPPILSFPSQ